MSTHRVVRDFADALRTASPDYHWGMRDRLADRPTLQEPSDEYRLGWAHAGVIVNALGLAACRNCGAPHRADADPRDDPGADLCPGCRAA